MTGWGIALLAGVCMLGQDVLSVLMVQAEARNRGKLAGALDSVAWLFGIAMTTITVTALQGHDLQQKVLVVSVVTAANFGGSWAGVWIGQRWIKEADRG